MTRKDNDGSPETVMKEELSYHLRYHLTCLSTDAVVLHDLMMDKCPDLKGKVSSERPFQHTQTGTIWSHSIRSIL